MRTPLAWIGSVLITATTISHAQSPQIVPFNDNETTDRWFVELTSPPGIEGTAAADLDREEAEFHAAATRGGVRYSKSRRFKDLWNGVIVSATSRDSERFRALPGVRAVYPV